MLSCAVYVWKRAIAVPLSARSMTTTTVSDAPSLAVTVLNLAARWQRQWRKTIYLRGWLLHE